MGQIFNACAYDIESMTCCVMDADKFHAGCYSFSGAAAAARYLLRQRPCRVIWRGGYASLGGIAQFSKTENGLGFSTCTDYEDVKRNNKNDGVAADSTEKLAGRWRGGLLQIVDEPPGDYKRINCCFLEVLAVKNAANSQNSLLLDTNAVLDQRPPAVKEHRYA